MWKKMFFFTNQVKGDEKGIVGFSLWATRVLNVNPFSLEKMSGAG